MEGQDLSGLTSVGIDETSWKRRHRYLTVFMDLDSKRVVFVAPTRQKDTLKGFLEFLRSHNGNPGSVRHFSCDLSGAYAQGIREHFPHATVTADRFHLVKLVNDAVDAVRRIEQQRAGGLKRTRFLWLKNRGDLSGRERTHLEVLLDHPAYARMGRAHALKEGFRDLFAMRPKGAELNLRQGLPQPAVPHGEAGPDVPGAEIRDSPVVFDPTLQRPPGGAEQPVPGGKGKSPGISKPQVRHPGFLPRRRSF